MNDLWLCDGRIEWKTSFRWETNFKMWINAWPSAVEGYYTHAKSMYILGMRETQLCICSHKFSGSVYQTLRFINVIDYNTTRVCENLLSAHRYILACPLSPLPGTIYILILNLLTLPQQQRNYEESCLFKKINKWLVIKSVTKITVR